MNYYLDICTLVKIYLVRRLKFQINLERIFAKKKKKMIDKYNTKE